MGARRAAAQKEPLEEMLPRVVALLEERVRHKTTNERHKHTEKQHATHDLNIRANTGMHTVVAQHKVVTRSSGREHTHTARKHTSARPHLRKRDDARE